MGDTNILSLVLATLVPMVVGFIYYHKGLMGPAWMKSIGLTEESADKSKMGMTIGISVVLSFLIAFFMLQFCNGAGQEGEFDSYKHGAAHGAIITLFFVMPIAVINALFEQRSMKYMMITVVYWLICLVLMGAIVDGMNHYPG